MQFKDHFNHSVIYGGTAFEFIKTRALFGRKHLKYTWDYKKNSVLGPKYHILYGVVILLQMFYMQNA